MAHNVYKCYSIDNEKMSSNKLSSRVKPGYIGYLETQKLWPLLTDGRCSEVIYVIKKLKI
jgi:hypothetical protein